MKIQLHEINEFDIETVLRYGRSGLVEGIEPIFFDRLEDYIDEYVDEYEELLEEKRKLMALRAAGVDNWEGFGLAMEIFNGEEE